MDLPVNPSADARRRELAGLYRSALLDDVIPFWLRHGLDRDHGGYLTALNRDGSLLDSDKSIWFQGRGAWIFATLYNEVEQRPDWLAAAHSGIDFLRNFGAAPNGKLYFSVTRDGKPLRMRRYAFSEAFAAIAHAAMARATGEPGHRDEAIRFFANYLTYSFDPTVSLPKVDPRTRPMKGLSPRMIGIVTAQELRAHLGDIVVSGRSCTEWIDSFIAEIERDFWKPAYPALLETVGTDGAVLDHFDGRLLNPGHSLECAWFILHEGRLRQCDRLIRFGLAILDAMWPRGWDEEFGGISYFRDLRGLPVAEYWHDMKFWWPHCEAIIATLMARTVTGDPKYEAWHRLVHDWSFRHFADPEFGEWYGYLHRDGRVSVPLKGNLWKGPFHLPRMLLLGWKMLGE